MSGKIRITNFLIVLITLITLLSNILSLTYAQNRTNPATETSRLEIYPNYRSLSVELFYHGDDDNDNHASFTYRKVGEKGFKNGVDMTPFRDSKLWRAGIFPLDPGVAYEIVATIQDKDGIKNSELKMTVWTLPIVTENKKESKFYVSTKGNDNNSGTKRKP